MCSSKTTPSLTRGKLAAGWAATKVEERSSIQRSIAAVPGGKIVDSENPLRDALIVDEVKQVVHRVKSHCSAKYREAAEACGGIDGVWARRIEIRIHAAEARGSVTHPEVADGLIGDWA